MRRVSSLHDAGDIRINTNIVAEQKGTRKLTKYAKVVLGILIIKLLFTLISMGWGLGNAIYYFLNIKKDYYPVVFYANTTSEDNITSTNDLRYILITNNLTNYTQNVYNDKLYYNRTMMEYCRIYKMDETAVILTMNGKALDGIEEKQFTESYKRYLDTTFFRFLYAVEIMLVTLSTCAYVFTLGRDCIKIKDKKRIFSGTHIASPQSMQSIDVSNMDPENSRIYGPSQRRMTLRRVYYAFKEFLFLLVIDVGFINIYHTKMQNCLVNVPPSRDLIAGFIGQKDLKTSGIQDYNLKVGTTQIWMNMIAFCVTGYAILRILGLMYTTAVKHCKRESTSERRLRLISDIVFEVIEMLLLLFLGAMMVIWRLFYINLGRSGDTFAITGKEVAKLLAYIFSCCM